MKKPRLARTEDLKERNILVLSPHPDDGVIGCGGTLHIYHQKGAKIMAVYMTDGRKGNPGYHEDNLVLSRKDEARNAATLVGIDSLIFLDNRDTELSSTPKTVNELSEILSEIKPEAVFLPFLLDNHSDHIATNDIFIKASRKYKRDLMCYGYQIWTPIILPNFIVDISSQIHLKNRAIDMHQSQIELCPIVEAAMGLSRYRGVLHNLQGGYAEVFFRCVAIEYRRLWQVIQ